MGRWGDGKGDGKKRNNKWEEIRGWEEMKRSEGEKMGRGRD
jgi:hypothetical protein